MIESIFQLHVASAMARHFDRVRYQVNPSVPKLLMSLSKVLQHTDPPEEDVSRRMDELLRSGLSVDVQLATLKFFWRCHVKEVELYPAKSRLLVNPPEGLEPNAATCYTLANGQTLGGRYGTVISSNKSTFQAITILKPFEADVANTFDDVTVFWVQHSLGLEHIFTHVAPGSTITVVFPSEAHRFWLGYFELDPGFDRLRDAGRVYRFDPVHNAVKKNAIINSFGLRYASTSPR